MPKLKPVEDLRVEIKEARRKVFGREVAKQDDVYTILDICDQLAQHICKLQKQIKKIEDNHRRLQ